MARIKGIFKDLDPRTRFFKNQKLVLFLTFIAYATFHATRKCYSVVKTRLTDPFPIGWYPFNDGEAGKTWLGVLDTVFLSAYAITMFFAGPLADRANLRLFVPMGLLGGCIGLMMWCLAYSYDIHSIGWFLFANLISGIFQSWGWPAIVCILGAWIQGSNRALILAFWNVNTYLGNMLGSLIGGSVLQSGSPWPYVFFYPALLGLTVSLIFMWLMKPTPADLGFDVSVDNIGNVIVQSKDQRNLVQQRMEELSENNYDFENDEYHFNSSNNNNINTPSQRSNRSTSSHKSQRKSQQRFDQNNISQDHVIIDDLDDLSTVTTTTTTLSPPNTHSYPQPTSQHTKKSKSNTILTSTSNVNASLGNTSLTPRRTPTQSQEPENTFGFDEYEINNNNDDDEEDDEEYGMHENDITFMQALLVPGVLEFSLSLFFCKLVSYTFLFWLPYYLASNHYSDSVASYLSIYFDLGGILGSIICGYLDRYRKPGLTSSLLLFIAVPLLYLYWYLTSQPVVLNTTIHISLLLILGILISGPYSLITTAVSVDLGEHPTLGTNKSAMATVSGIIDGFGSLGSINSGLLISLVSKIGSKTSADGKYLENWNAVFILLMICAFCSSFLLIRIVRNETGYFQWLLTCMSYLSCILTCGLCCRGNNNDNDDATTVNITFGDDSLSTTTSTTSSKRSKNKKNIDQHEGDDLDSLGHVNDPSQYKHQNIHDDSNSIRTNGVNPEKRYKKETKQLEKEIKKNKKLAYQNQSLRDGGDYDDNNEQQIDVSKLYAQARK